MRPFQERNEIKQNAMKVAKRVTITILICLPFLLLFGYLTRNVITQNWLQILINTFVLAVAVVIEEAITRKKERIRQGKEFLEGKKDVFK